MEKAKEVPAFTKPVGGAPGAERTEGAYRRDKSASREHTHKNTGPGKGYGNVGKAATNPTQYPSCCPPGGEREEGLYKKKDPYKEHVHKNTGPGKGYGNIGKAGKPGVSGPGATGAERKGGAYKKKPYTR